MPTFAHYTVSQAARRLKISDSEALRLIASMGIRPTRLPSGEFAFPAAVIDDYAGRQERAAAERRAADDAAAAKYVRPRSLSDVTASDSSIFDPLAQSDLDGPAGK